MASTYVAPYSQKVFTIAASGVLATYSPAAYSVDKLLGYPTFPSQTVSVFAGSGGNTTTAFSAATQITITAGSQPVYYNTGVGPVVYERKDYQTTPGTLNATGTLTAALILGGIVTSSTAAAVAATLDTGTVMDAALTMAVDDCFTWTVINTGGNTFTVTAAAGHTIVGVAAVVTVTSARFLTRKTAANTFVTYRLA
jgi:hypothetical protein